MQMKWNGALEHGHGATVLRNVTAQQRSTCGCISLWFSTSFYLIWMYAVQLFRSCNFRIFVRCCANAEPCTVGCNAVQADWYLFKSIAKSAVWFCFFIRRRQHIIQKFSNIYSASCEAAMANVCRIRELKYKYLWMTLHPFCYTPNWPANSFFIFQLIIYIYFYLFGRFHAHNRAI